MSRAQGRFNDQIPGVKAAGKRGGGTLFYFIFYILFYSDCSSDIKYYTIIRLSKKKYHRGCRLPPGSNGVDAHLSLSLALSLFFFLSPSSTSIPLLFFSSSTHLSLSLWSASSFSSSRLSNHDAFLASIPPSSLFNHHHHSVHHPTTPDNNFFCFFARG